MKKVVIFLSAVCLLSACKSSKLNENAVSEVSDFTIAFGSCNKHTIENVLWDDIVALKPDIWVWGGDNVYADTDNMEVLEGVYNAQNEIEGYKELKKKTPIIGAWDDHDYGLNDGGVEFAAKSASQQKFLDFMDVPKGSPRRNREGIYASHDYQVGKGSVKVIILDTRYFRTALTPDTETKKRHKPNEYGEGTILGTQQWQWFENELTHSKADFNVIVSSIQFLSNEHGFECWGNFPHEVDRFKKIARASKAKGVLLLSGDRHISEISRASVEGLRYPLIDFTSSGLTHAYSDFKGEPNPFRVGEVVSTESFGVLEFNFKRKTISMKMLGDNGVTFGVLQQSY